MTEKRKYTEKKIEQELKKQQASGVETVRFVYWEKKAGKMLSISEIYEFNTKASREHLGCFTSKGRLRIFIKRIIAKNINKALTIEPVKKEYYR